MKKILVILIVLFGSVLWNRVGLSAASYFELQVPMTEKQSYGEQQIVKGHFTTTVNAIDEYGHAYTPGSTPTGPRRVGPIGGGGSGGNGGLPSDPFWTEVVPIGDIPWVLLVILIIVYIAAIVPRTHSRRTFKLLLSHLSRVEQWRKILKK